MKDRPHAFSPCRTAGALLFPSCGYEARWRISIYYGREAHGGIAGSKHGGFGYMIALLINVFGGSAFRAVTDPSKVLEFIAVRLHDVAVIDMDDGMSRTPFL